MNRLARPALRPALLAATLLALAGTAAAATSCRILSATGLAFGPYNPMSMAPLDSEARIDVSCSREGGPQKLMVTLRLGAHGTPATGRRMQRIGGGDSMAYGLYSDVGRSSPWGYTDGVDTVSLPIEVPNKGSASVSFRIFGRIPAQPNVMAGSYSDRIPVTVMP